MRLVFWGCALSVVAHIGAFEVMSAIPKDVARHATVVTVFEAKPKRKAPEDHRPKPAPPAPPKSMPLKRVARRAARAPENAPPPPVDHAPPPVSASHAAMDALPGFGLSLSGVGGGTLAVRSGVGGPGGISGSAVHPDRVERKRLKAAAPKPRVFDDGPPCNEEPTKPKPIDISRPQYPDEARSAETEGKVVIRLTVDASGKVSDVQVIKGLGHGCDESAIMAARRWTFKPSMRCGRPVSATFTTAVRFGLTE